MTSRKSAPFGHQTTQSAGTHVSIQPQAGVSSPARTAPFPGKRVLGSELENSQIDRRTLEADTSGISLQESYNTQPREEVSGEASTVNAQIPEASTELPPVYSPV
jgi:hypothetical protein